MNHRIASVFPLCGALALLAMVSLPAHAESIASSASSAGSESIGSISDSIHGSSRSSSGDDKHAAGDYRVVDVAVVDGQPQMQRLTLRAQTDADRQLQLDVPQRVLQSHRIGVGDIVTARARAYGLEFAHATNAQTREPFFLALNDDWRREIDARPITP